MARGSRRASAIASPIANAESDPLVQLLAPTPAVSVFEATAEPLSLVQDNRVYHPEGPRQSVVIGGRLARVVVHNRPAIAYGKPIYAYRGMPHGLQVPVGTKFESPFRVVRCLRRKIRREVIFALRKEKKGAGARKRRRNPDSGVKC